MSKEEIAKIQTEYGERYLLVPLLLNKEEIRTLVLSSPIKGKNKKKAKRIISRAVLIDLLLEKSFKSFQEIHDTSGILFAKQENGIHTEFILIREGDWFKVDEDCLIDADWKGIAILHQLDLITVDPLPEEVEMELNNVSVPSLDEFLLGVEK